MFRVYLRWGVVGLALLAASWVCGCEFNTVQESASPDEPMAGVVSAVAPLTNPAREDPSTLVNDAVVRLLTSEGAPAGTGTLVAPDLVLTAGHCLMGAIVDGDSGTWDGRSPTFLPYSLPKPSPNPGWTSGIRGDTVSMRPGIIAPFNYRDQSGVASASSCQALCLGETRCVGWTYYAPESHCFLKQAPKFKIRIGNRHDMSLGEFVSSSYSVAGWSDIALIKLDRPVPAKLATPSAVITRMGNTVDEVSEELFWLRSPYAVGFTTAQPTRRRIGMQPTTYPNGVDVGQFLAQGTGGSVVQPGDSGSPIFVDLPKPDGLFKRYVFGTVQGLSPGGNRYVLTGVNKADIDTLVSDPRRRVDLHKAAMIREWLEGLLPPESLYIVDPPAVFLP